MTGKPDWQQPVTKDRSEVLSYLAGVAGGRIGRRKGRGKPHSDTTIAAAGCPLPQGAGRRTTTSAWLRVAATTAELAWSLRCTHSWAASGVLP